MSKERPNTQGVQGEVFIFICNSEVERQEMIAFLEDPYQVIEHGYNGEVFEVDYSTLVITIHLKKDVDLSNLYKGLEMINKEIGHELSYERINEQA